MKMLKYKATFKDDSEFVPWMFGIARNACLAHFEKPANDHLHRRRHRNAAELDEAGELARRRGRASWCARRCCAYRPSGARSSC